MRYYATYAVTISVIGSGDAGSKRKTIICFGRKLNLPESLPCVTLLEVAKFCVSIDVGINKLIALSNGSFVENPKLATNKNLQLRIRQRRVNRKVKRSNNRNKAGIKVAKLHKKIADRRNDYQWKAAKKVVETADAVIREGLNIKAMKLRCKPKKIKGRFMKVYLVRMNTEGLRPYFCSAECRVLATYYCNLTASPRRTVPPCITLA